MLHMKEMMDSALWRWTHSSSCRLFWWHWEASRTRGADGSVWLCAAWWKTACQMRHGSINLDCWPLHARRRDKWIHGSTFGRLDESAGQAVSLPNEWTHLQMYHILNHRSCANTSNTRILQKVAWRKESETPNGNCCRRQSETSFSSRLHWWSSLSLLCYTKTCIHWTLYSEIMGPLIGWSVTKCTAGWVSGRASVP